jgi:hypothetical protein
MQVPSAPANYRNGHCMPFLQPAVLTVCIVLCVCGHQAPQAVDVGTLLRLCSMHTHRVIMRDNTVVNSILPKVLSHVSLVHTQALCRSQWQRSCKRGHPSQTLQHVHECSGSSLDVSQFAGLHAAVL